MSANNLLNLIQMNLDEQVMEFKKGTERDNNNYQVALPSSSLKPKNVNLNSVLSDEISIEEKLHQVLDQYFIYMSNQQQIDYSLESNNKNLLTSYFTYLEKRKKYLKDPEKLKEYLTLEFKQIPHKLHQEYRFLQQYRITLERNQQAYQKFIQQRISQFTLDLLESTQITQTQSKKNSIKAKSKKPEEEVLQIQKPDAQLEKSKCKNQNSSENSDKLLDFSSFLQISNYCQAANSTQLRLTKYTLDSKQILKPIYKIGCILSGQMFQKQNDEKPMIKMRYLLKDFQKYLTFRSNLIEKYLFLTENATTIKDLEAEKNTKISSDKNKKQSQKGKDSQGKDNQTLVQASQIHDISNEKKTPNTNGQKIQSGTEKMDEESELIPFNSSKGKLDQVIVDSKMIDQQKKIDLGLRDLVNKQTEDQLTKAQNLGDTTLNKCGICPDKIDSKNIVKPNQMEIESSLGANTNNKKGGGKEEIRKDNQQSLSLSVYFNQFYLKINSSFTDEMEVERKEKQSTKYNIFEDSKSLISQLFKQFDSKDKTTKTSLNSIPFIFKTDSSKQQRKIPAFFSLHEAYYSLSKKRLFEMASPHKRLKMQDKSIKVLNRVIDVSESESEENNNELFSPMANIVRAESNLKNAFKINDGHSNKAKPHSKSFNNLEDIKSNQIQNVSQLTAPKVLKELDNNNSYRLQSANSTSRNKIKVNSVKSATPLNQHNLVQTKIKEFFYSPTELNAKQNQKMNMVCFPEKPQGVQNVQIYQEPSFPSSTLYKNNQKIIQQNMYCPFNNKEPISESFQITSVQQDKNKVQDINQQELTITSMLFSTEEKLKREKPISQLSLQNNEDTFKKEQLSNELFSNLSYTVRDYKIQEQTTTKCNINNKKIMKKTKSKVQAEKNQNSHKKQIHEEKNQVDNLSEISFSKLSVSSSQKQINGFSDNPFHFPSNQTKNKSISVNLNNYWREDYPDVQTVEQDTEKINELHQHQLNNSLIEKTKQNVSNKEDSVSSHFPSYPLMNQLYNYNQNDNFTQLMNLERNYSGQRENKMIVEQQHKFILEKNQNTIEQEIKQQQFLENTRNLNAQNKIISENITNKNALPNHQISKRMNISEKLMLKKQSAKNSSSSMVATDTRNKQEENHSYFQMKDPSHHLDELLSNFVTNSTKGNQQLDDRAFYGLQIGQSPQGGNDIFKERQQLIQSSQNQEINSREELFDSKKCIVIDHNFLQQQKSFLELIRSIWKRICILNKQEEDQVTIVLDLSKIDSFTVNVSRSQILSFLNQTQLFFKSINRKVHFHINWDEHRYFMS